MVSDKNGCTAVDSVLVRVSDSLTPIITGGPLTICTGDTVHLTAGSGYSSYAWSDGEATPDISVTRSGDFSVRVTGGAGCAGTSSAVHVTVLPDSVPQPVLTSGATTICAGDSVLVQTTKSYAGYQWSTGATTPSIYVSNTDTVTVTATNASGCSGTSAPLGITVLPAADASITASGATSFCSGDSVTLSGQSGYAHYQWTNGDTTPSVVAKTSGVYAVTVTNAAGCSATSTPDTVTVNPTPVLIVVGPAAVCPNATATYVDSTNTIAVGDFFEWELIPPGAGTVTTSNPVSITIQWGAAGTASLIATETTPGGCTATAHLAVAISSNLSPVITGNGPLDFCSGDSVTLDAGAGYVSYQWSKDGTQISGDTSERITVSQSGGYTVFVTSAGGCSGTSQVTKVLVYATPATPVITRNGSQLISSPASEYQWYFNGSVLPDSVHQTIWPDTEGLYSVTITDSNGCQSTSDPFAFTTITIAKVSVAGGLGAPGDTIKIPVSLDSGTDLAASGATTYVATIGLDATMLTPLVPTGVIAGKNWRVTLTGPVPSAPGVLQTITALALDSGFCSSITIDTFYFPNTAIGVITESNTFCVIGICSPEIISSDTAFTIKKIYPNPTETSFTILYHVAADGPLSIDLEDYLGRHVCELKHEWTKAGDENETYSAQGISSGAYRLVLRSGSRVVSSVVVVSK